MFGVVYKITNLINNKIYIGQTTQKINRRFLQHCEKRKSIISIAINKYGKDKFKLEILESCESLEELNTKEKEHIIKNNSIVPFGYNLSSGGNNFKHNKETKLKLSKLKKGKPCKAQSLAMQGKKQSIETRKKKALQKGIKTFSVHKNNNFIGSYISIGLCSELLSLHPSCISRCLSGKRKSHKGFIFNYEVDNG